MNVSKLLNNDKIVKLILIFCYVWCRLKKLRKELLLFVQLQTIVNFELERCMVDFCNIPDNPSHNPLQTHYLF